MSSKENLKGDIINIDDISGYIIETSTKEYCNNALDVVFSKTTETILKIIGMQINTEKKGGEKINVEKIVSLYRAVFIERYPITHKEWECLRDFFSSKNTRAKGDKILSNIIILQSDCNKEFTRNFLEDTQGKYTTEHFIAYIGEELKRYPFVINIALAEGERIEFFREINGVGKIYSYVDAFGKHKLFLIKENKEILQLNKEFNQKPEVLENGLIFCGEIKLESDADKIIDVKNAFRHSKNQGYFIHVGVIYRLDPETNQLKEIYSKEGLISVQELSQEYALFQTTNEDGRKGLIKIREGENFDVSEILQELYDRIHMGPDETIVTEMKDKEIQEDDTFAFYTIVGIHIVTWDDRNWSENKLCGKTLLGEVANYSEFDKKTDLVYFYKNKNICRIWTKEGYKYYIINKEQEKITEIDGLNGVIQTPYLKEDFFDGIPALGKKGSKAYVLVYNKETKTTRNLIEIQCNYNFPEIQFFHEIIELSLYGFGTIQYRFHKGKLYEAKEGFEFIDGDLHKKRLFWTSKNLGISIRESFDKISVYLEEIKTPVSIKFNI
ncbi:hypothetical protein COY60_02350 [Candidatus Gracilibacteria bacterium CG_4_10_14_0_8_um_filter_38_28]|nr:MAG: hypothetical protein COY60_02350 [Candidatus Gracilibacteria bacterium CG_4_10_14_0_8_um_filter_38_28]